MPSGVSGVESTTAKLAAALEEASFPSVPSIAFIKAFLPKERVSSDPADLLLSDTEIKAIVVLSQAYFDGKQNRKKVSPQRQVLDELLPGKVRGARRSTILAKNLSDYKLGTTFDVKEEGHDPIQLEADAGRRNWPSDY